MDDARSCDPGDFGREPFYMVLLSLKDLLGDKHGEIGILDTNFLNFDVEPF